MDYNINFPHLHIYLDHVGKNIMIGNFSIAYYGIVIAIGMLAGLGIACWMAKRTGQSSDTYFDLALVAIVCSVIGARIYYVVFFFLSVKSHCVFYYLSIQTDDGIMSDSEENIYHG